MSITTKRGDKGETDLFDGTRVGKADARIVCLASIDELNSWLGVIGGLEEIQSDLFTLGAIVAHPKSTENMSLALQKLEARAAELEGKIPALKNFILPGGEEKASQIHLARAVCRRAETQLAAAHNIHESCLAYLNRLSDALFLMARARNLQTDKKEVIWKKM